MAKSWIDKIVYKITQKPTHYKEVKNPPKTSIGKLLRPQDARQIQYNNWSKAHTLMIIENIITGTPFILDCKKQI